MNTESRGAIWASGIDSGHKIILLAIDYLSGEDGVTTATISEISWQCAVQRRTLQRKLKHMRDLCWLVKTGTSSMRINFKSLPASEGFIRVQVFDKTNGRCWYCGCILDEGGFQMDHQTPRSKGGSDEASNLVPSCTQCNRQKSDMVLDEYREKLGVRFFYGEKIQ